MAPEKRERYNFEVTSGESLFLERNPAVNLLLSCLRYLVDPGSRLNMSLMVRSYVLATGGEGQSAYAGDTAEGASDLFTGRWQEALNEVQERIALQCHGKNDPSFRPGRSPGECGIYQLVPGCDTMVRRPVQL